jgi:hypothetical protein
MNRLPTPTPPTGIQCPLGEPQSSKPTNIQLDSPKHAHTNPQLITNGQALAIPQTGIQSPLGDPQSSKPTNMQLDYPEHANPMNGLPTLSLPNGIQCPSGNPQSDEPNMQPDSQVQANPQLITHGQLPLTLPTGIQCPSRNPLWGEPMNMQLDNPKHQSANQHLINCEQPSLTPLT